MFSTFSSFLDGRLRWDVPRIIRQGRSYRGCLLSIPRSCAIAKVSALSQAVPGIIRQVCGKGSKSGGTAGPGIVRRGSERYIVMCFLSRALSQSVPGIIFRGRGRGCGSGSETGPEIICRGVGGSMRGTSSTGLSLRVSP